MTESARPPAARAKVSWRNAGKPVAAAGVTIVIALLLMTLVGVFREKVPDKTQLARAAAPVDQPVMVRLIRRPRYETAAGTVKPVHETSVGSKLLARVVEVNVRAGQAVRRDDVLIRLDDADLQARLQQAQAVEQSAAARLKQATADHERARKLLPSKAVAQADFEQAEAAYRTATSELERARHAVQEMQVVLRYATIRSPMDGTVVEKRVDVGDTVSPGQVLVTLYDPTRMQMVASVRESLALKLAVGQKLPARLESLNYECEAEVSEIVPEAQAASRSFQVKVTGPCPPGVYSGMFGRLSLPVGEEELIVVPRSAIRQVGQLTMVDVVAEGSVGRRAVRLGRSINEDVEVLSGLRPGEKVLLTRLATESNSP